MLKGFTRAAPPALEMNCAIPVPSSSICRACLWLFSHSVEGEIVATFVLVAFVTLLRQCHFLLTPTGMNHLIPRSDLSIFHDKALIYVRSSKITPTSAIRPLLILPTHSSLCPVMALRRVLSLIPADPAAPIFLDPRTRGALRPEMVLDRFKTALAVTGFRNWSSVMLHSLRRSGVHACVNAGVTVPNVQSHGGWRSDAIRAYLPKTYDTQAPTALRDLIIEHED